MIETGMRIRANGRQIYGTWYGGGKGKKPLVIFSHGFNGSAEDFSGAARDLARRGVHAFCFDFCGGSVHTRSDMTTEQMSIGTECEDLNAVLDEMLARGDTDRNRVVLFGGSQGGLVSALVAAERAQDVAGLFLLFPALCIPDNWTQEYPDPNALPARAERWGVPLGAGYIRAVHGMDVYARIRGYGGRVFIAHGDRDEVVPLSYSERAAREYKDATLRVFAGEGHGFSEAGNAEVQRELVGMLEKMV